MCPECSSIHTHRRLRRNRRGAPRAAAAAWLCKRCSPCRAACAACCCCRRPCSGIKQRLKGQLRGPLQPVVGRVAEAGCPLNKVHAVGMARVRAGVLLAQVHIAAVQQHQGPGLDLHRHKPGQALKGRHVDVEPDRSVGGAQEAAVHALQVGACVIRREGGHAGVGCQAVLEAQGGQAAARGSTHSSPGRQVCTWQRPQAAVVPPRILQRQPNADAREGVSGQEGAVLVGHHLAAHIRLLENKHRLQEGGGASKAEFGAAKGGMRTSQAHTAHHNASCCG